MPTEAVRDARKRGYRYKVRATRAKPIQLTPRDLDLIHAIYKYRVLQRAQIENMFFAGVHDEGSSARRRLNLLYQHGYLERIPRFVSPPENNPGPAYRLSQRSAVLISERDGKPLSEFNYWGKSEDRDSHIGIVGHAYLEHNLVLSDIRIWFEQQATQANCTLETWLDYFDLRPYWKTERVAIQLTSQAPLEDIAIAPDGYFVLKTTAGRGHFFVEFDRGTETIGKQWKRKVQAYKEYLRSGKFHHRYGVDNKVGFRVLVITTSMKRAENLHKAAQKYGDPSMSSLFMFAGWPKLKTESLTSALWLRGSVIERSRLIEAPA
jgi:hypothetical protein